MWALMLWQQMIMQAAIAQAQARLKVPAIACPGHVAVSEQWHISCCLQMSFKVQGSLLAQLPFSVFQQSL